MAPRIPSPAPPRSRVLPASLGSPPTKLGPSPSCWSCCTPAHEAGPPPPTRLSARAPRNT
eukprot:15471755-Alexandrium_andersonii.AAC.1